VSALGIVVVAAAAAAVGCLVASLATGDVSWVDRIWSIAPVAYVAVFAGAARFADARLDVMALLVAAWGARLTYNLARKGGYRRGAEDYRWAVLRARMGPARFALFSAAFICLYQNALLVAICLPAEAAFESRGRFGLLDGALAALFVAALAAEGVADTQQWRFQRARAAALAAGAPAPGFCTTGLFRYSRHPAYFFEITQWWLVGALGVSAAGVGGLWALVGAALLTQVFVSSTRFTESISASRHPGYGEYQRSTSAVVPWRPRRAPAASP
jgi:steroid 5-alpha reductase family enzyme